MSRNDLDPSKVARTFALALALGGCGGPADEAEPGRETGACVEYECLGELVCLSNLCVDPNAGPGTGGDGGDDPSGDDAPGDDGGPASTDSVSILVVVDNSGSMGEEQARLPSALLGLTDALTTAGVQWRLGITTTDNGNPWCDSTSPEAGQLVASSCRARTQDFVFNGASPVDATDEACLSQCPEAWDTITLRSINGTYHPWIQQVGSANNLPEGLSMADALGCMVPQGIAGCGFESQLESAYRAISRANTAGEANEGFVPDGALLVVLFVSDEADCSLNPDHETIFLPDGSKTFWSNPDDGAPTSAVCWNAGVSCSGSACTSQNVDENGNAVDVEDDPGASVLYPLLRYTDALGRQGPVLVTLVGGVASDGSVTYAPSAADPGFELDFGIGPGCESASGRAVPPVRMRELAEAFPVDGAQTMFSICDASYAPAMSVLANSILARVQP